jgi:hypothetical protein
MSDASGLLGLQASLLGLLFDGFSEALLLPFLVGHDRSFMLRWLHATRRGER